MNGPNKETRWLFFQLRPLLSAHVLSILLVVLSSVIFLVDPLIMKWFIDIVLPNRDIHIVIVAALGIGGVYLAQLSCYALAGVMSFRTAQKLAYSIRLTLLNQINRLSADFLEAVPLGDKLYRMEQDVDQVAEIGSNLVPYLLQTVVTGVFVVSTMFVLNFRLTCVLLPLVPIFVTLNKYFEIRLRLASDRTQEASSKENNFLQEHLSSVIQIQLLRQEASQIRTFMHESFSKIAALSDRNLHEMLFRTFYLGVIAIGVIAILTFGGEQVLHGALTVGGFVAFYSYLARLFTPLSAAVDIYSRINRLNSSIRRILEIIEEVPSVRDNPGAVQLVAKSRCAVVLDAVFFTYAGGFAVLKGVDLDIKPGEKIALAGASGCGKSTIAKLIARLYDVNRGILRIDGIDVRNIALASLRSTVCYVTQEPVLFDRTIKANLLMGNPGATLKELWEAVELVGLKDLLLSLPQRLDTRVGPRGSYLSGGERQRLAIARAVLQRPAIILLDESTSALDIPSERALYIHLTQHFADQTILFVSHRLSALTWVDRIVVLDEGVIKEQGTHEDLAGISSIYNRLYKSAPPSSATPRIYSLAKQRLHPSLTPPTPRKAGNAK